MIVIPLPSDTAHYTTRVALDGVSYVLTLEWSQREARWYLSLADGEASPIAVGIKVVAGWPLLRKVTDARRPTGDLYALDTAGLGAPPAYEWGDRWVLVYA